MKYYQYIRVHHTLIPDKVMEEYQFTVEPDGYVYLCICQGMYSLKEARVVAFKQLVQNLLRFVTIQ